MAKMTEEARATVILNGQQANATLKEIEASARALNAELKGLKTNTQEFADKSKQLHVSGNYKCRISVNKNASKSASLISDLQRNKILKNVIFKDRFSVFQPVRFTG